MVFNDERHFMNTGTSVAIYEDTLVIGTSFISLNKGGYVTVYERKNNKGECTNIFSEKELIPGYQFPMYSAYRDFIAANNKVIAVGARSNIYPKEEKHDKAVLFIAKQNEEWNYVDTIYGEDFAARLRAGEGFASGISVDDNKIMILVEGSDTYFDITGRENVYSNELKKYLYKDIKSSFQIYSWGNGIISQIENVHIPFTTGGIGSGGGIGQISDNQIFITTRRYKYIDNNEAKIGTGRISVYEYINDAWELKTTVDNNNASYLENPLNIRYAAVKGRTMCIMSYDKIYVLNRNDDSWNLSKIIDMPKRRAISESVFAFEDNIIVVATRQNIYVYRCDNNGEWNLTDIIGLYSLTKRGIFSVSLSISDHTLALGINNVDITHEISDGIAYLPYMPFFFPKNPGSVCIIELLPDKGYEIADIIVRDYSFTGKVRFKSALKK
jgi:hypothetical protein